MYQDSLGSFIMGHVMTIYVVVLLLLLCAAIAKFVWLALRGAL